MPATVLSVLYILIHLIDITSPQGRFCFCSHLIDKETEAQKFSYLAELCRCKPGIQIQAVWIQSDPFNHLCLDLKMLQLHPLPLITVNYHSFPQKECIKC